MSDNVINLFQEDAGYIIQDKDNITGVYCGGLCANNDKGNVVIGHKIDGGIDYAMDMKESDLNKFCVMWLGIHNPESLRES